MNNNGEILVLPFRRYCGGQWLGLCELWPFALVEIEKLRQTHRREFDSSRLPELRNYAIEENLPEKKQSPKNRVKIGIHRRGIDRSITEQTELGGRKQDPSTTSFWERSKSAFPRERGIGGRPWSATPFPVEPDIPLDKRSCCWSITAALAAGDVAVMWFWWGSSEISLEGLLMGLRSQGDLGFEGLRSGQEQEGIVLSICSRKSSWEAAEAGSKWWRWDGGICGGGGFKWWLWWWWGSAWRSWREIWAWFKRELRVCISLLQGCIVAGGERLDGERGSRRRREWNIWFFFIAFFFMLYCILVLGMGMSFC